MATLIDAIEDIDKWESEATIYAATPWREDSVAAVAFEPDGGEVPKGAEGLSYFLEVFVARDFLEDWVPSLEFPPTLQEQCARLIEYAINDV